MNRVRRRLGNPLILCAFAVLGLACNETKTPTEPTTVTAGQPASVRGRILSSSFEDYGATSVEIQKNVVYLESGEVFDLSNLVSGKTTAKVTVSLPSPRTYVFENVLLPGSNIWDIYIP